MHLEQWWVIAVWVAVIFSLGYLAGCFVTDVVRSRQQARDDARPPEVRVPVRDPDDWWEDV